MAYGQTRAGRLAGLLIGWCTVWAAVLAAVDAPTLVQEIKNGADGVQIPNHVTSIVPVGNFVYVGVEYSGIVKCFKREADGKLTFVSDTAWAGKNDSIELCAVGHTLYGVGGSGHRTGNGDSRGLHWWSIDPTTGALTAKGSQKIPISRFLTASADGKALYTLYSQKRAVARYSLGADGAPALADETVFPDAKGEISSFTLSPDRLSLYCLWIADQKNYAGHARVGADGKLTVQPTIDLGKLTEGCDWPKDKWGFGWGRCLRISPDGKQAYAVFNNYGDKHRKFLLYTRDPQTGGLTYKDDLTEKTTAAMTTVRDLAFAADGASGWFVAGAESGGDGGGAFTRDPQTGALAFGAAIKEIRKSGPCTLAVDAGNKALYIGCWSSNKLFVLKTP